MRANEKGGATIGPNLVDVVERLANHGVQVVGGFRDVVEVRHEGHCVGLLNQAAVQEAHCAQPRKKGEGMMRQRHRGHLAVQHSRATRSGSGKSTWHSMGLKSLPVVWPGAPMDELYEGGAGGRGGEREVKIDREASGETHDGALLDQWRRQRQWPPLLGTQWPPLLGTHLMTAETATPSLPGVVSTRRCTQSSACLDAK